MKVRTGFVSNSSTSSFMIWGTYLSAKKLKERTGTDDIWELETKGLMVSCGPDYDDDGVYIGMSWLGVKDDETGAQFKARTEAVIKSLLGDDFEGFRTYQEAWRDG